MQTSLRVTDVTAVVDKQGWTLKKPLMAKMTKSVMPNLPDPVVIFHQLGKDGDMDNETTSITLSPKEKPKRYGNLINAFTIMKTTPTKNIEE